MRQTARALLVAAALLAGGGALWLASQPPMETPARAAPPSKQKLEVMMARGAEDAPLRALQKDLSGRLSCEVTLTLEAAERYDDALALRLSSGLGPDLFEVSEQWAGPYAAKGWLLPLDGGLPESAFDPLPQGARAAAQRIAPGGVYAVPAGVRTVRLVCHARLFETLGLAPPASYAELISCAEAIHRAAGGEGVCGLAVCGGEGAQGCLRLVAGALPAQGGAGDSLDPFGPWQEAVAAMRAEGSLYFSAESLTLEQGSALFAAGGAGMLLATSSEIARLEAAPDCVPYFIALPPTPTGEILSMRELPRAGYFAVNADAESPDLTLRALELLLGEENLRRLEDSGKLLCAPEGSALPPRALPTLNEAPFLAPPAGLERRDPVSGAPRNP
jgi:ABC-type glycerol-3-phosphate transport system substrate-binding protein